MLRQALACQNESSIFSSMLLILILLTVTLLSGCGGTDNNNPGAETDHLRFEIAVGQAYSYSVPESITLPENPQFTIVNKPKWAEFDQTTGNLSGIPGYDDIGESAKVTIVASSKSVSKLLPPFTINVLGLSLTGFDVRPTNETCHAVEPPSAKISVDRVFSGLKLNELSVLTQAPGDSSYWYFATREGLIGRFENSPEVTSYDTVLDMTAKVREIADGGFIQMIFHKNYPQDRRVFVNYSTPSTQVGVPADIMISSFVLAEDGGDIDPDSEVVLIRQQRGAFHQGGFMAFDAEGMLLLSLGDGTYQGDPNGNAQSPQDIRGAVLRIDVDNGTPYSIPDDNPYAESGGNPREEIYAKGFRNPFRGDIDPATGKIYIADVGTSGREEVNVVVRGGNHGWNIKEGSECYSEEYGSCSDESLIDPLYEYAPLDGSCAIIGGLVYNGSAIPEMQGLFVFGDHCSNKIAAVSHEQGETADALSLLNPGSGLGGIRTFGRDNDGELYIATNSLIYKINPVVGELNPGPAARISDTGCFQADAPQAPVKGLISYDINSALWSDGAEKKRWFSLPDGKAITLADDGDFLFPAGTVLAKQFLIDGEPIETRLLMKDETGLWAGYSYEWIGDDAYLLENPKFKLLDNGQTWYYPGRGDCSRCHTEQANFSLGLEVGQLNKLIHYPETNRFANQLSTLEFVGAFEGFLPNSINNLPAFAGLDDTHLNVSLRAKSYLHSNCSGCHRGEGVTQSEMNLKYSTPVREMEVCNKESQFDAITLPGAKILEPQNPELSIIYLRPSSTDEELRMPPLATALVHPQGTQIIEDWIRLLNVCAINPDSDKDTIPDFADNCPDIANISQFDIDRDGKGDACDRG